MEKARLPDTQQYAAAVVTARTFVLESKQEEMRLRNLIKNNKEKPAARKATLIALREKIHELQAPRRHAARVKMFYGRLPAHYGGGAEPVQPKRQFVKACIAAECKGFLNEEFECTLCSTKACKECHESLAEGHTCNPDVVANVKALAKEARPCPTCAANISKIDGCDQMWCTQCQTTFSWRTGLKEAGHTHNPHYYEFLRRNGGQVPRAPGDQPAAGPVCGMPNIREILTKTGTPDDYAALTRGWENYRHMLSNQSMNQPWPPQRYAWNADTDYTTIQPWPMPEDLKKPLASYTAYVIALTTYHQHIIHQNQYVPRLAIEPPDNHQERVEYMLGELDEKKMRSGIQRKDKAYRKELAKRQVYEMVYQASSDIYRNMLNTPGQPDLPSTYLQLVELLTYANKSFDRLEKVYTCTIDRYNVNPF